MLAAALVLWFVYSRVTQHGFDWNLAATSLSRLRWGWLLLSLVPIFGTYYGRALRWAVFLKPLKPHPSIANLLSATIVGFTAITLFGRPGEFVRPYLIAVKEQVPVPSQFAAWVLERIFDLLMALLVFAFALTQVDSSRLHVGSQLAWVMAAGGRIVGAACVILLAILLSLRHFAEPVQRRLVSALRFLPETQFHRIEKLIVTFVQGVEATRSDGALILVFVYSVIEWLLIAACYWSLARAFSGTLSSHPCGCVDFYGVCFFRRGHSDPRYRGRHAGRSDPGFDRAVRSAAGTGHFIRLLYLVSYICSNCAGRLGVGTQRGAGLARAAPDRPGGIDVKCPFCNHLQDKVVDSRETKEGDTIRRRRECLACERRFTTYERIDEVPYMVVKKDGRREKFDRQKVLGGLLKACEKRPVSMAKLSELVNRVESKVSDSPDREISTTEIGEYLDGQSSRSGQDRLCTIRVRVP